MSRILVNTEYFSEAANDFKKNKGIYTKAPYKSREFMEYWGIQKKRCIEGYTVGDLSITGRHYWYLNFCPIKRSEDEKDPAKKGWNVMKEKELLFPKFWLIDYEWWWAKEIAMRGMLKEDVANLQIESLPIIDYTTGKHLVCVKTRRAGFSYKEAADGAYNYNFVPRSKSYFFASNREYLVVDGILNKFETYLEHLDKNTQNFWKKNRMEKDSLSDMHWKASYIDSHKNTKGYQSEVIGVIINDPNKVRGKDGVKITYEEAGSFKNLSAALAISLPSVKDGSTMTGQISVFGTGGEEGPAIAGLEDLIYNPHSNDFLEFKNIWEDGMENSLVGYFVPCYMANKDFMDASGNVDKQGALDFDEGERQKQKETNDPKKLDRRIAEFPRTIDEALSRSHKSVFSRVEQIRKHRKAIANNLDLLSSIRHGTLIETKKGVTFVPVEDAKPLDFFPHQPTQDLTGCVSISRPPELNFDGVPLGEKYQIIVDPYYKDGAVDTTSLWAAYVVRKMGKGDPIGGRECARYVGRPEQLETCYELTALLSKLYGGAKIQCEIQGGGADFFRFLKRKNLLHIVNFEPLVTTSKEIVSEKNRSYFMNVTTESKRTGLSGFAGWFEQVIGIDEEGEPIYRFQTCTDLGLLDECIKWKDGLNVDRISSWILFYFMNQEEEIIDSTSSNSNSQSLTNTLVSSLFNTPLSSSEMDIVQNVLSDSSVIGVSIEDM